MDNVQSCDNCIRKNILLQEYGHKTHNAGYEYNCEA
jgi:hypothetical protein